MSMRIPTRIFFQKTGRIKYLAHLDTMRAFMRAIARADLPVWYTEGYNPQIYISFALSLSLGYEGLRESFDIYLLEEMDGQEVKEKLNRYLPDDLQILSVAPPVEKATAITWADYRVEFLYDEGLEDVLQALTQYIQQEEILVEKKTKRRSHTIDLADHMKSMNLWKEEDCVTIEFRIKAGNFFNINPRLFAQGFESYYKTPAKHVAYTRIDFLNQQEELFA